MSDLVKVENHSTRLSSMRDVKQALLKEHRKYRKGILDQLERSSTGFNTDQLQNLIIEDMLLSTEDLQGASLLLENEGNLKDAYNNAASLTCPFISGNTIKANVEGTNINHQYSKSFEFEKDFDDYVKKYFGLDIHYFSLLRGISEFQIGRLFSNYKHYHSVFKSCNLGSKEKEWIWCCNCSKCLFIYIILFIIV